MGVPRAYIGCMSQRYPVIHLSSSQQTQQMLTFFAQVFEIPEASDELLDILLSTPDSTDRLWRASFAAQQGVYTYLQSLGANKQSLIELSAAVYLPLPLKLWPSAQNTFQRGSI